MVLVIVVVAVLLGPVFVYYQNSQPSGVASSIGTSSSQNFYSTSSSVTASVSNSVSSRSSNLTSASLLLDRSSGPTGQAIALSGGGYDPGAQYQICIGTVGNTVCGFDYVGSGYPASIGKFATLGDFITDAGGNIPNGAHVTIPDLFGGSYVVGVVGDGRSDFVVSAPFTVTSPTLSLSSIRVVTGTSITLTGANYAPGTIYTVCMVVQGTVDCGYAGDREETPPGIYIGTFTADPDGNIPLGTMVTIPVTQPPGEYAIGIFTPSGGFILISTASFTLGTPT